MKYNLMYLFSLFCGLQGFAQQDLETYLQVATEKNPRVQAAYLEFEAALQRSPQVSSLPDPTLTASAFGQMMETRLGSQMAKFQLMQMFPWFGILGAKENAADLMAEAKFQQFLDTRNQVLYEVRSAYAELYAAARTVEIQQENLQILDSYRELAISGFRSGKSRMVSVVKIDIEREASLTEIELLEQRLQPLKAEFNSMLDREPQAAVAIQDTLILSGAGELAEAGTENHPAVLQLENQRRSYQAEEEVARKEGLPMVGLGIDYSVISKRTDANPPMNGQDAFMPMVSVSLPIFRKKYKAREKEAEFMSRAMEEQRRMQSNDLNAEYEMTLYELEKSGKLLGLYQRQLKSLRQARTLLTEAFSNSTGSFEEILDLNQDILVLKTQQIESVKNGFQAEARIQYLVSKNQKK